MKHLITYFPVFVSLLWIVISPCVLLPYAVYVMFRILWNPLYSEPYYLRRKPAIIPMAQEYRLLGKITHFQEYPRHRPF
jgi:hypothetical protein